jgi:hypothetical protein
MIPWSALVRHAPALLAAADALLARSKSGTTDAAAPDTVARLRKLEQSADESAQLLRDLAEQVHALTAAQQHTARRARVAVGLGIAALVLAAAAALVLLLT